MSPVIKRFKKESTPKFSIVKSEISFFMYSHNSIYKRSTIEPLILIQFRLGRDLRLFSLTSYFEEKLVSCPYVHKMVDV